MSKHTPGPWQMSTTGFNVGMTRLSQDWVIHNKDDIICSFPVNFTDPTAEANARLIAAAPEMLAALKMMVHAEDDRQIAAAVILQQQAIAKAEGNGEEGSAP